jgi:hypothetical protein
VDKFWMVGSQKEKLIRESENEPAELLAWHLPLEFLFKTSWWLFFIDVIFKDGLISISNFIS